MWQISKLSGSRSTVKEQLAANKTIPPTARDLIAAQVDALPLTCVACVIDAFAQDIKNPANLTTTLNIQMTIKGIHA